MAPASRRIVLLGATGYTGQRMLRDSDGRSLIIAVASDNSGAPLTTTVLTGPDPYEMTASLLAWGATRAASPGAQLAPGVHGPVTAFGLDALEVGAAQAGIQQISQERPPDA
jgi:short subunit dehydrogenase-like uncharacterized protein